jgi:hypothetical protein
MYYSPAMQTLLKKAQLKVIFTEVQPEVYNFQETAADSTPACRRITRRVCTGLMLNTRGVIALQKECMTATDLKVRGPFHVHIQLTHMRKAAPYYNRPISFESYFTVQKHPTYNFFLLHPSKAITDRNLQSVIDETFQFNVKTGKRLEILPQQADEVLAEAGEPRVLQEVKLPTDIPWFE